MDGMTFPRLACVSLALVLASPAFAAGHVSKGPAPSWIDELAIPAPRDARMRQAEDGVYYLVDDAQIRPEQQRVVSYYRTVSKVTDRGGLESAARLDVEFDPSDEDVVIHRLAVIRGTETLDRLADTKVQILQREKDLDGGVMDGRQTAHLDIPDVHVGDIVDIAYSRIEGADFWPGNYFDTLQVRWSVPLELGRNRVLLPASWHLTARGRGVAIKPTIARDGERTIYEWRTRDADPLVGEKNTPAWYASWGEISISTMASWEGIVARTLPLYAGKDRLPPALVARVARIEKKFPRPEDRITEALRLVQDELRYVSLSMGEGSYVPRDAATVWASGFGDCKDKASLLAALLNAIGIEAHVALTDIDEGRALPEHAPSPYAFDHAITMAKLDGRTWWLEPTLAHQGGRFPHLAGVPYDYALPIAPGQKTLERIPAPTAPRPTERTTERYEIGRDGALSLRVSTTYLDADADWMRDDVVSKSPAQIEKDYLKFYAGLYPGIESAAPIRFRDDRDANRIVVEERYRLSAARLRARGLNAKFTVKASSLDDYDDAPSEDRRTPYALTFPLNKTHRIVVVTPGRQPGAPEAVKIDGPAFRYDFKAEQAGDTLTLDYHLEGKGDALWPKDIVRFRADSAAIKDANYWELDLTRVARPAAAAPRAQVWLAAALLLAGIALYALHLGLHADDAHAAAADAVFHPVSRGKFVLVSAATGGLYPIFWAWKCWRWSAHHEKRRMLPFWRAAFSVFWLYPLFADASRRSSPRAVSSALGAATAAAYLAVMAGAIAWTVLHPGAVAAGVVAGLLPGALFLPALDAVNALNRGHGAAMEENSKITGLTLIALMVGVVNWAALLGGVGMLRP